MPSEIFDIVAGATTVLNGGKKVSPSGLVKMAGMNIERSNKKGGLIIDTIGGAMSQINGYDCGCSGGSPVEDSIALLGNEVAKPVDNEITKCAKLVNNGLESVRYTATALQLLKAAVAGVGMYLKDHAGSVENSDLIKSYFEKLGEIADSASKVHGEFAKAYGTASNINVKQLVDVFAKDAKLDSNVVADVVKVLNNLKNDHKASISMQELVRAFVTLPPVMDEAHKHLSKLMKIDSEYKKFEGEVYKNCNQIFEKMADDIAAGKMKELPNEEVAAMINFFKDRCPAAIIGRGISGGMDDEDKMKELQKKIDARETIKKVEKKVFGKVLKEGKTKLIFAVIKLKDAVVKDDIKTGYRLKEVVNKLEQMMKNFLLVRNIEYSLSGYFDDIISRQKKDDFETNLRVTISYVNSAADDPINSSIKGELNGIKDALESMLKSIEKWTTVMVGDRIPNTLEAIGHGEDDVCRPVSSEGGKIYAMGGSFKLSGADDLDDEEGACRTTGGALTGTTQELQAAIDDLKYFYNLYEIKDNLRHTAVDLDEYGASYDKVLGQAIARKLIEIDAKYASMLQSIRPTDEMIEAQSDPVLKKAQRELRNTYIKYINREHQARRGLYKTAESVDLYLKIFTKDIVANVDQLEDIKTMLDNTEVVAEWHNEDTAKTLREMFTSLVNANVAGPNLDGQFNIGAIDNNNKFNENNNAKTIRKNLSDHLDNWEVLHNIISIFTYVGEKFGNTSILNQISSEGLMKTGQMYNALKNYMKYCSFLLNVNDGNAVESINRIDGNNDDFKNTLKTKLVDQLGNNIIPLYSNANAIAWLNPNQGAAVDDAAFQAYFDNLQVALGPATIGEVPNRNIVNEVRERLPNLLLPQRQLTLLNGAVAQVKQILINELKKYKNMDKQINYLKSINKVNVNDLLVKFISDFVIGFKTANANRADFANLTLPTIDADVSVGIAARADLFGSMLTYGDALKVFVKLVVDSLPNTEQPNSIKDDNNMFILIIKAMAAKVYLVVETYKMMNIRDVNLNNVPLPLPIGTFRTLLGGGEFDMPTVIENNVELYLRLTLLGQYYKRLLIFADGNNADNERAFVMIPDKSGIFGPFIDALWLRKHGLPKDTEQDYKRYIIAINAIAEHFKNEKDPLRAAVHGFVSEINRRYGVYTKQYYDLYEKEFLKERDFNAANRGVNYDSSRNKTLGFKLLDGEDDSLNVSGPSDKYMQLRQTGASIENDQLSLKYKIDDEQRKLLNRFRRHLEETLKGNVTFGNRDFRQLVQRVVFDLRNKTSSDERFRTVTSLFSSLKDIPAGKIEIFITFHEFVTLGLNTLMVLNNYIETFKFYIIGSKNAMDGGNAVGGVDPVANNNDDANLERVERNIRDNQNALFNQLVMFIPNAANPANAANALVRANIIAAFEKLLGFTGGDKDDLVSLEFVDNKFIMNFDKLQTVVTKLLSKIKDFIEKMRSQLDENFVKDYVDPDIVGSYFQMEKYYFDLFKQNNNPNYIYGFNDAFNNKLKICIVSTGDNVVDSLQYILNGIPYRLYPANNPGRNVFNIIYTYKAGPDFLNLISHFDPVDGKTKKFYPSLRFKNNQIYDWNNPLNVDHLLIECQDSAVPSIILSLDDFSVNVSQCGISIIFNRIIASMLKEFYDNGKYYQGLFGKFINCPAFSTNITNQTGFMDIFGNDGTATSMNEITYADFSTVGVAYNAANLLSDFQANFADTAAHGNRSLNGMTFDVDHILCRSLAIILHNISKARNSRTNDLYYVEKSLSEVSQDIKDKYKVLFPSYIRLLRLLHNRCQMYKNLIRFANKQTSAADVAVIQPAPAPAAAGPAVPANGEAYTTLNNQANVTRIISMIDCTDKIMEGITCLIESLNEILNDLGNTNSQFFEIENDFIKNYQNANGKRPFMPLSVSFLPQIQSDALNTDIILPGKNTSTVGSYNYKYLAGMRPLVSENEIKYDDFPGLKDIVETYNSTNDPNKISEEDAATYLKLYSTIMRYNMNNSTYRRYLSVFYTFAPIVNFGRLGLTDRPAATAATAAIAAARTAANVANATAATVAAAVPADPADIRAAANAAALRNGATVNDVVNDVINAANNYINARYPIQNSPPNLVWYVEIPVPGVAPNPRYQVAALNAATVPSPFDTTAAAAGHYRRYVTEKPNTDISAIIQKVKTPYKNDSLYSIAYDAANNTRTNAGPNNDNVRRLLGQPDAGDNLENDAMQITNIIDLNIVPINIHAMMREIALANIYNYAYTFDSFIKNLYNADGSIRNIRGDMGPKKYKSNEDELGLLRYNRNNAANPVNVPNIRKFLLVNPLATNQDETDIGHLAAYGIRELNNNNIEITNNSYFSTLLLPVPGAIIDTDAKFNTFLVRAELFVGLTQTALVDELKQVLVSGRNLTLKSYPILRQAFKLGTAPR